MYRLLSHRGRFALLLAGLLGFAPCGAAPPLPATDASRGVVVEMAWMGDPVTFRCPLRANCSAAGLEVTGCVPDASARTRALQMARQNFSGPVLDRVTIGKVGGIYSPSSPEQTYRAVFRELAEVIGEQAHRIEVGTRGDGEVTLRGKVGSAEDRHAISARLRLVSGCACVVNLLEVTPSLAKKTDSGVKRVSAVVPVMKPETTGVTSTPSKETVVVVESPALAPKKRWSLWHVFSPSKPTLEATRVTHVTPVQETSKAPAPPRKLPAPVTEPARAMPSSKSNTASARTFASPYGVRPVSTLMPQEVIATSEQIQTSPRPLSSATSEPVFMPSPVVTSPTPAAPAPESIQVMPSRATLFPFRRTPKAESVTPSSEVVAEPIAAPRGTSLFRFRKTETVQSMPTKLVTPPVSDKVEGPQSLPMPTRKPTGLLSGLFRREEPAPTPIATHPTPNSGVSTIPTRPSMPTRPASPAVKATVPDKPYATTGTVIFHPPTSATTPATVPVTTPIVSAPALALRQKILSVCGRSVKDVLVVAKPNNGMDVTIIVKQHGAVEEVVQMTAGLEELFKPQVKMTFEVDP